MATRLAVLGFFHFGHFLQEDLDTVTLYHCSPCSPEVPLRPELRGGLGSRAHHSRMHCGSFPVSRHLVGKTSVATAGHRSRMQLWRAAGPLRATQGGLHVLRSSEEKGNPQRADGGTYLPRGWRPVRFNAFLRDMNLRVAATDERRVEASRSPTQLMKVQCSSEGTTKRWSHQNGADWLSSPTKPEVGGAKRLSTSSISSQLPAPRRSLPI